MDPRIIQLKSTTFSGRRFTRRQITAVQRTVAMFPKLSRKELAETICEHLGWHTPGGANRVAAALSMLQRLELAGVLKLPPKREGNRRPGPRPPIAPTPRSAPRPPLHDPLRELTPLRLRLAEGRDERGLFNEFVERYHYLGYRQPRGPHLRYFLLDRHGRRLGCLLFSQATHTLHCRDAWVGWQPGTYKKHLHLVVSQPRFLLFPWVRVKNLASHALARAARQLPRDWQRVHGATPVLVETFVNPERFRGTCYRAANWLRAGRTKGRADAGRRPKDVYLYPLAKRCRAILRDGPPPARRKPPRRKAPPTAPDAGFVALWQGLIGALSDLAAAHDRQWQRRSRVLNTLLIMLFVFRLVFAPRRQGYTTTLAQLWAQCQALDVPLPQPRPVSDAAMCKARPKLDETVFKQFHAEILRRAERPGPRWHGHRVFAVDGSKLTLPRPLVEAGYKTPGERAHYPQGLLSCLLRLQSRLPVDFDLCAHGNERVAALAHLQALRPSDLVVYDRGYYSFEMLRAHDERGLHAVFRLKRKAGRAIDRFLASERRDTTEPILPGPDALRELRRRHPGRQWRPLRLRLVKYTRGGTEYALGTTLLDRRRYRVDALADLYHARWGIEEMYRISKQFLEIGHFHGRSERLVRQELFAHFNLVAMTRLLTNRDERLCAAARPRDPKPAPQANFKHSLAALGQHLEGLLLRHRAHLRESLECLCAWIATGRQRPRPGRSYPRRSLQPASKWSRRRAAPEA